MHDLDRIRERLRNVPDPVALLEGLFAYAPVGLQVYNADGHCLLVNQAFRDLMGSEPPPEYNVLKDEILAAAGQLAVLHRAFAGEVVRFPPMWYDPRDLSQVKVSEGRRVAVQVTMFPLFDSAGRVSHVALIATDVTAMVRERERAEMFAALVENSTDFVGIADPEGRPLYVNEAGRRMVGFPDERDLRETSVVDWYAPEAQQFARDVIEPAMREGKWSGETAFRNWTTGESIPVSDSHFRVTDPESGKLVCYATITRDISAEKQHAREREELLAAAEQARKTAEEASRAKDEFLAMLGHELRNPLAPIVSALELMKLRSEGRPREQDVIERQVHHLVRLVDDLLDVSRITRGKVQLRREAVEILAVVTSAVQIAMPLLEQRAHHLVLDVPTGLHVYGDAVRLAQVFANLLTNAAKFTPTNGRIDVRARRDGESLDVTVTDSGIGISPELLPRVFELFMQGPRSADRADGGLGLGLAIVRSLVDLHNGEVTAHSDGSGHGATFRVRLPALAADAVLPATPSAARIAPVQTGASVLVVDDNHDAAEMLAELLRAAQYRVAVAYDGASALLAARSFTPDVAVLDLGLPVMDGYDLAAQLRATHAGLRLVALSGYGQERDVQRSRAAGFETHLVKPVRPDELLRALAGPSRRS